MESIKLALSKQKESQKQIISNFEISSLDTRETLSTNKNNPITEIEFQKETSKCKMMEEILGFGVNSPTTAKRTTSQFVIEYPKQSSFSLSSNSQRLQAGN